MNKVYFSLGSPFEGCRSIFVSLGPLCGPVYNYSQISCSISACTFRGEALSDEASSCCSVLIEKLQAHSEQEDSVQGFDAEATVKQSRNCRVCRSTSTSAAILLQPQNLRGALGGSWEQSCSSIIVQSSIMSKI